MMLKTYGPAIARIAQPSAETEDGKVRRMRCKDYAALDEHTLFSTE